MLVLTPVCLIVGLVSFLSMVPDGGTAESAVVLSLGWSALWVFATVAYVLFGTGSFVTIRQFVDGVFGQLVSVVSVLVIPLVLVALASATYSTRALVGGQSGASVAPDQIPLALNVMEATTDGVMLVLGILFGTIVFVLGNCLRSESGRWRAVGFVGMLLGVVCLAVNFGALVTASQPLVGILAVVAVSLWLLPVGWFVYRGSGHFATAVNRSSGTLME